MSMICLIEARDFAALYGVVKDGCATLRRNSGQARPVLEYTRVLITPASGRLCD